MSKKADHSSPLRRIVRYEDRVPEGGYTSLTYEVLECGHAQLPKVDVYGETIAVRRRCKKCAKEQGS